MITVQLVGVGYTCAASRAQQLTIDKGVCWGGMKLQKAEHPPMCQSHNFLGFMKMLDGIMKLSCQAMWHCIA
eukprot:2944040-Amphidinium_carterae.1